MAIKLMKHQVEGRDFLLKRKKAVLIYGIGTGKTFTALDALARLPPGRVLILAPKSVLKHVWLKERDEYKNYDLEWLGHAVTYLNYEKVSRDAAFTKRRFDYIIADECHKLKGRTSKVSKRVAVVARHASHCFGLTGTPTARDYTDLFLIFKHLGIFEFEMTYETFVRQFYTVRYIKQGARLLELPDAPRMETLPLMMMKFGNASKVKRTEDCVELPAKIERLVYVDGMVTPKYKEFENGFYSHVADVQGRTVEHNDTLLAIEKHGKMHQAANNFYYDKIDREAHDIRKVNPKIVRCAELMEELLEEEDKVIVVYYFKHDLEQLVQLPFNYTTDIREFENADKNVLYIQFSKAEGVNLQFCNQMIFYSYAWSFVSFDQMCGRIYRNGQTKKTHFYTLISKGTVEELIWRGLLNKRSIDEYLKEVLHG